MDMDGTLAEWRNIKINFNKFEDFSNVEKINDIIRTPGYFLSLNPHQNVVDAVRNIIKEEKIEVYILSCILPDTTAKTEKEQWLDKYLPEIDKNHRIFVPDGEEKRKHVPNGIRETDFLFDDYTKNLNSWEQKGVGSKLLNDVNSSKGTWCGNQISFERKASEISLCLSGIILGKQTVRDNNPRKDKPFFDYEEFDFSQYAEENSEIEK